MNRACRLVASFSSETIVTFVEESGKIYSYILAQHTFFTFGCFRDCRKFKQPVLEQLPAKNAADRPYNHRFASLLAVGGGCSK
jgi:hypothetical protein